MQGDNVAFDELLNATIGGRYRIISRLGAGGMGVAYRAWDEQAGVPVVIKIPKRIFLEDPQFAERFYREIRLLQGLKHPHIVPIVGVGEHEGVPFVVMRFLPGGSLSNRRLRDDQGKPRPNPPAMLHLWLPAIAEALDYVHSQGVVHRDVKPANIFFDAFWGAYLGDFGIAKIVEQSDTFDKEHTLTATHMGIGTQEYMAPEQFAPKAVIDGKADQYALAVMVYEILAGKRPFTGETAHLVVEVTTYPVPPIPMTRGDVPPVLVQALHRALAKQPSQRFATCREFAAAVLRNVPPMSDEPGVARLLCPNPPCSNLLILKTNYAGRKGKCPKCQGRMKVAADLGALWLLDEERQKKIATESSDVAEVQPRTEPLSDEAIEDFKAVEDEAFAIGQRPWGNQLTRCRCQCWNRGLALAARLFPAAPMIQATWISFACHVALVIGLALAIVCAPTEEKPRIIIGGWVWDAEFEELEEETLAILQPGSLDSSGDYLAWLAHRDVQLFQLEDISPYGPANVRRSADLASGSAVGRDLLDVLSLSGDVPSPGGFSGRTDPDGRKKLVKSGGGNAASEAAVEAALKWIVQHQLSDGGWTFDLADVPSCKGQCSHGREKLGTDRCAATAMALLPLLGRGYTHKEGPYKKQFEAGIGFLAAMAVQGKGKVYGVPPGKGGNLYSQGLAGIALSETYAMTQDKRLAMPAQLALNYIMSAQDPVGGGWRYSPKQPGDMSATGWQLIALKSGHMALFQVSPFSIKKTVEFLDHVQSDNGASYGYTDTGDDLATSAVGLLCRMYLGWKKDNPALQRGVARLAKMGPSADLYFNYYATQVLHHIEGEQWVAWNTKMRDMLVKNQAQEGHEKGSWYESFDEKIAAEQGGRLLTTSLATMILEVYYRHLPLYAQYGVHDGFRE